MEFGAFIRGKRLGLRNENGRVLTQRQVGKAVGRSAATVSAWEDGARVPRDALEPLAVILRTPIRGLTQKWEETFGKSSSPEDLDAKRRLTLVERTLADLVRRMDGYDSELREINRLLAQSGGRRSSN